MLPGKTYPKSPPARVRTRRRGTRRQRGGLTLIELMVTLVILALAAALVVPQMAQSGETEVIAAARILAADLQYAQNLAISTQVPVTVTFGPSTDVYSLSSNGTTLTHPITKDPYQVDFSADRGMESVDLVSASFDGAVSVTFDELGTPVDSSGQSLPNGKVVLRVNQFVYEVRVAAVTGKVTVVCTAP